MRLNKEKILSDFNSNDIKSLKITYSLPMIIEIKNKNLIINNISTSDEFIIPYIMISIMKLVNLDEYLYGRSEVTDSYDKLIVCLYNISHSYTVSDSSYWENVGTKLLKMISAECLDTRNFRNDIYENLEVVSGYIRYSNKDDEEFY